MRFSYARSADDMREAVARIARWLGKDEREAGGRH
jgi:hypothetical protein